MKVMFVIMFLLVLLVGCSNPQIVGDDRDEHGCIGTAGYTWCEAKQKCLQTWEEDCPASIPQK